DQVFGGDSGAEGGDADVVGETPDAGDPDAPEGTTEVDAAAQQRLNEALAAAGEAFQAGQEALTAGDWAAYGAAQDRLDAALADAIEAEAELAAEEAQAPDAGDGAADDVA